MKKCLIVGIAGGSGSGKTTFANRLREKFGDEISTVVGQDSYYIDQSNKFDHDGGAVNFDHPSALDFDLMAKHLEALKTGATVNVPIYDFTTHKRLVESVTVTPKKIIFVDGILILSQPQVREQMDICLYIDCPEDLRFSRRLSRDVKERGRSEEGVRDQFYKQVKPMHDEFVGPSKNFACDVVNVENFENKCSRWKEEISSKIIV